MYPSLGKRVIVCEIKINKNNKNKKVYSYTNGMLFLLQYICTQLYTVNIIYVLGQAKIIKSVAQIAILKSSSQRITE